MLAALGLVTGCGLFVDLGGFSGDEPTPSGGDGGSIAAEAGPADTGAPVADGGSGDAGPPQSAYREAVLADKPVAYWPMGDESGSLVAKDIVGGKNATLTGNATFGVPGVAGTAISIDDRSAYLEVGDVFDFPGKQPFTIEVWGLPTVDDTYTNIGAKRANGSGWVLYFRNTGTVQFEQYWPNSSGRVGFSEQSRTFTTPAHVVVTYDGSKLAMYYDNVKLPKTYQDDADGGGPIHLATPLYWAPGYHGLLDEIAIYDHALPADRVSAHFKAGTTR